MKSPAKIRTLFVDIGGVLLSDGWQTASRKLAAKAFRLDFSKMEERHRTVFDTYEEGKLTLEEYLAWVVFYKKRPFTRTKFRKFMFAQSKPYSRNDRASPPAQGNAWIEDHCPEQRSS